MNKDDLKISQAEFDKTKVSRLSDRPNVGYGYGGRALSAQELKERYDASAVLLREHFNALIDAFAGLDENGERIPGVADLIMTGIAAGYSLGDLFSGLGDGSAMQKIKAGIDNYSVKGYMQYLATRLADKLEAARVDVAVEGLEHGQNPTVSWQMTGEGEDKRVLLTFAIPEGKEGKDGASGVYVGSGPMPEDCNIKVDPSEEAGEVSTVRHSFIVNEDSEVEYIVSNDGVWNAGGGYRYHNKEAFSVWRYPIEDAASVSSALWHGHTAQQTLLQASVNGEDWVTLIDNGGAQIGHQDYIDVCDHLDIAVSGTSWLYVRIGDSDTTDGSGGAILNDMPVTMDITYGGLDKLLLPTAPDDGKRYFLRYIGGRWRPSLADGVVSRVFTVSFRVAEDSERKYIDEYSNGTDFDKTLDDTCRFMDGTRYIIYKYHLPNSGQIRRLYFTATFKQKVLLEVSTDKEKWVELLRCEPGEDGKGMAKMRMTFDLTDKVNLLRWDDIYIRLSNSDAPNGFGGAVMRNESVDLRIERFELPFGY